MNAYDMVYDEQEIPGTQTTRNDLYIFWTCQASCSAHVSTQSEKTFD